MIGRWLPLSMPFKDREPGAVMKRNEGEASDALLVGETSPTYNPLHLSNQNLFFPPLRSKSGTFELCTCVDTSPEYSLCLRKSFTINQNIFVDKTCLKWYNANSPNSHQEAKIAVTLKSLQRLPLNYQEIFA